MLRDVSTDNGSLFYRKESVIFCDDYVQYDNSSLFFRAVIDCWIYSMVHSVLVDSCKIIWDVLLFCFKWRAASHSVRCVSRLGSRQSTTAVHVFQIMLFIDVFTIQTRSQSTAFLPFKNTRIPSQSELYALPRTVRSYAAARNSWCFGELECSSSSPQNVHI
jgi:hypothetical protein